MFVWTLTIGFTLSFGGLFSKTWRVYKIFTAAKSMERVVSCEEENTFLHVNLCRFAQGRNTTSFGYIVMSRVAKGITGNCIGVIHSP